MKSSINIGKLLGISIEINYSWLIIFGLITWTLAINYFPAYNPYLPQIHYWIAATISSLLLFTSLLAHELSHSIVANRNNMPIKKITLFIFGGVAQLTKEPDTPQAEFKVAIAGPLCSLAIVIISILLIRISSLLQINNFFVSAILNYVALINTTLLIFNIIPGFPLDGGRILRAAIWQFTNNLRAATRIATSIGKAFAFLLMLLGFAYLFQMQFINGVWFLIIGLFLHEAADMSFQQLVLKNALVGIKVKEIMDKNVIYLTNALTLEEAVNNYFLKHRYLGFPVVENGNLKGIINIQSIKSIPKELWNKTLVKEVMIKAREDLLIHPNDDVLDALLQLTKSGLGKLLVIQRGKLLGIIGQRDILNLLEIRTHLGSYLINTTA